jgi:DNA polymerase-3 subunit beta
MKVQFKLKPLAEALEVVRRAVPSKTDKEVLKYVKLDADALSVRLAATDGVTGVVCEVSEAIVESQGAALLSMRATEALRRLSGDDVTIEFDGDHVKIAGGSDRFKLQGADPFEHPPIGFDAGPNKFDIESDVLSLGLRLATVASDKKPGSRYALEGVHFDCQDDELILVATDTHVMTAFRTKAKVEKWPGSVTIPARAVSAVQSAIKANGGTVSVCIGDSQASFRVGTMSVVTRLLDGRFPKWRIFPNKHKVAAQSVAGPLLSAIERASLLTEEDSRGVDFGFGRDVLTLKTQSADVGESEISLPIVLTGEPLEMLIDPRWFALFLKELPPEQSVRLEMLDADHAATVKLDADPRVEFMVMPLSRMR